jgi:hypothetical protein
MASNIRRIGDILANAQDVSQEQSGRSMDPEIRRLLDEFLGEPKDEP